MGIKGDNKEGDVWSSFMLLLKWISPQWEGQQRGRKDHWDSTLWTPILHLLLFPSHLSSFRSFHPVSLHPFIITQVKSHKHIHDCNLLLFLGIRALCKLSCAYQLFPIILILFCLVGFSFVLVVCFLFVCSSRKTTSSKVSLSKIMPQLESKFSDAWDRERTFHIQTAPVSNWESSDARNLRMEWYFHRNIFSTKALKAEMEWIKYVAHRTDWPAIVPRCLWMGLRFQRLLLLLNGFLCHISEIVSSASEGSMAFPVFV